MLMPKFQNPASNGLEPALPPEELTGDYNSQQTLDSSLPCLWRSSPETTVPSSHWAPAGAYPVGR